MSCRNKRVLRIHWTFGSNLGKAKEKHPGLSVLRRRDVENDSCFWFSFFLAEGKTAAEKEPGPNSVSCTCRAAAVEAKRRA